MVTNIHECCLLCMNGCKTAEDKRPHTYTHWADGLPRTGYCEHYAPYQQLLDFINTLLRKANPMLNT